MFDFLPVNRNLDVGSRDLDEKNKALGAAIIAHQISVKFNSKISEIRVLRGIDRKMLVSFCSFSATLHLTEHG